ncbi:tonB-dependent Receptor Plug domain protein [Lysobacter antibioticus]|uniref:TonB-dependent receptor n=1 Tax=Lysobacter antibioticus TaxID=84531 RepID=UPI000717109F|nr:TonB-dependent receptor [Lysobacter antibioticus]ALN65397.1 tonB-dependent Receptor Plug domain protein [Lysobacter antibioticus]
MPRFSFLASALLAALAAPVAHADEAKDIDRVTVSASTSRMPNSEAALANTITVIDQEQLRQQLAVTQDISQVLANLIPSFAPSRQKLTNGGETLRGRKPLYLIDGVPQSTPLREGGRDGHTIDPAMIERIEVIHGANALQGLGASGGIINIITKRAPRQDGERFHELSLGASTALPSQSDGSGYRASYLFGTRQGAFDFVGGVSFASEGLYYDGNGNAIAVNDIQGDLMDARSNNLFAKAGWDLDEQRRLQLTANRYELEGNNDYITVNGDIRSGRLATSARGSREGQGARNRSTSLVLDYTDKSVAGGYLQAQLYWVDFKGLYGATDWEDFWRDGRDPHWWDQSQNVSEKLGGKFSWSRDNLFDQRLRVTLGLDWGRDTTYQELVVSGLKWVPETQYESWSPFVQAEWWVADKVMLTGGVRHERGQLKVDDFTTIPANAGGSRFVEGGSPKTSKTLPNFGAVWEASDALKFYASYSEGYTVADIGRVLRGITAPNQRVDNLIDLSPVVSDNREVGLDFDDGRWVAHVAAYWSDSDLGSRLAFDRNTQSYNVVRERTEIRGVEANLAFRFSDAGRVGLGYAGAEGRYDSDGDDRVDSDLPGINISPDRIIAFWDHSWSENVSTRLQGSRSLDRDFDLKGVRVASTDGYTTLDLQARFKLPAGQLNLGVENLLDEQYVTYYSQSTPRNDTYVAGRGRVLSASWQYRF